MDRPFFDFPDFSHEKFGLSNHIYYNNYSVGCLRRAFTKKPPELPGGFSIR